METNTKKRITKVLKKVTNRNIEEIDIVGDIKSQLGIDSIQIVELFAELEEEFAIELPLEMMTVRSGQEFIEKLNIEITKNVA